MGKYRVVVRGTFLALLSLAVVAGMANPVHAIQHLPRIILHVGTRTIQNHCSNLMLDCCEHATTEGHLNTFYDLFVLAAPSDSFATSGVGIAGIQFGLDYNGEFDPDGSGTGLDIFSWTLCATLEFPSPSPAWPNPGSGTLITWDPVENCQHGPIAVAGYFYMAAYDPASVKLVWHPTDHQAKVADCNSLEVPIPLGITHGGFISMAAFSVGGSASGGNSCPPCADVAVQSTTWSRIKSR